MLKGQLLSVCCSYHHIFGSCSYQICITMFHSLVKLFSFLILNRIFTRIFPHTITDGNVPFINGFPTSWTGIFANILWKDNCIHHRKVAWECIWYNLFNSLTVKNFQIVMLYSPTSARNSSFGFLIRCSHNNEQWLGTFKLRTYILIANKRLTENSNRTSHFNIWERILRCKQSLSLVNFLFVIKYTQYHKPSVTNGNIKVAKR